MGGRGWMCTCVAHKCPVSEGTNHLVCVHTPSKGSGMGYAFAGNRQN